MEETSNKALKEWATVLKAMGEGRQILLFRKGGIIERHDEFEVESPEFFLYPTYLHQAPEKLQTEFQPWIAETEAGRNHPKQVEVSLYATVEKVMLAKGIERLRDLTDAHIWAPEFVEKAWSWAPEKPAYILFLRVYKMASPQMIDDLPEYGGCISWIDLREALPVGQLTPVLSDAEFAARCDEIVRQLSDTAMTLPAGQ